MGQEGRVERGYDQCIYVQNCPKKEIKVKKKKDRTIQKSLEGSFFFLFSKPTCWDAGDVEELSKCLRPEIYFFLDTKSL